MMKTMFKAALAATVATGLFAAPAFAANSDTKPFTATAKIVKPLTLVNTVDLDFGTITMLPALSSTVVTVGRTGGAASVCDTTVVTCSAPTAAVFTVSGVALQTLNVTVASTPAVLTNTVDSTKTVPFSADPDATVALNASGAGSFDIGGAVTVAATTAEGTYSADIDVTVAYP
jgi:hypothetical protein